MVGVHRRHLPTSRLLSAIFLVCFWLDGNLENERVERGISEQLDFYPALRFAPFSCFIPMLLAAVLCIPVHACVCLAFACSLRIAGLLFDSSSFLSPIPKM